MNERFAFDTAVPLVVQDQLHKHLPNLGWVLPTWAQRVTFFWTQADDGEVASIEVSYEYRFAAVYLTSKWLARSLEQQREDLLHELLHISSARWPIMPATPSGCCLMSRRSFRSTPKTNCASDMNWSRRS